MCIQDAARSINNSRFYLEQFKTGITYPRPLWRPQPSTLLCQGPPNRLHRWGFLSFFFFFFFFRSANLPFKSDRIINLLIAVAVTEEEEEEEGDRPDDLVKEENHAEQASIRQTTTENTDGWLHPAVYGQRLHGVKVWIWCSPVFVKIENSRLNLHRLSVKHIHAWPTHAHSHWPLLHVHISTDEHCAHARTRIYFDARVTREQFSFNRHDMRTLLTKSSRYFAQTKTIQTYQIDYCSCSLRSWQSDHLYQSPIYALLDTFVRWSTRNDHRMDTIYDGSSAKNKPGGCNEACTRVGVGVSVSV